MKKLLTFILTAIMSIACVFGLTACGNNTLIVYTEAGFAPFEYVSNGQIVGVDVDIMKLVGQRLGKNVVFENVNFNTIIDTVKDGKLAKVGAAGISITPERQEKVDFSNEYYTAALYVIYPTSLESSYVSTTNDNSIQGVYWNSLAGKRIAVQNGTTADLFLGDELDEGGTLYETGALKTGFSALATATADIGLGSDVLIIDELPAKKLIEGNANLKCAPLYYQAEEGNTDEAAVDVYAICVTKGETELLNAINAVLAELGSEGIQELVENHLGLNK